MDASVTLRLIFLSILQINFALKSPPIIDLPSLGKIQGDVKNTTSGRTIFSFEGVPYARPPIGKYRFREPAPVKPWPDIWVAKTIFRCLQYNQFTPPGQDFVVGDEDCLYLNIYTSTLDPKANLDVIIFIHGGAFMFNYGAQFQPDYILDKDNVVFITLNYRLGPLGFLTTENDLVPGNNGIKDQILALQWIQNNIQQFGGNPNSVTITGMSAGGASVHLHYLIPKSKGLFHKGISQSGTALNPWVLMENGLGKTKQLGKILGCVIRDLKKLVDCLKQRPSRQIVNAVREFLVWGYNPFSPFGVVVDSWSSDPLLPEHPYKLIRDKKVADLPWIASQVSSEGLYPAAFFYNDDLLQELDSRWNDLIPFILDYNHTVNSGLKKGVSEKIRAYYFKNAKITKENYMALISMCSDRLFVTGIDRTLRVQSEAMKAPVYYYYFGYRGAHSKSEIGTGTHNNFGVSHADDTSYVFKTIMDVLSTENDRKMSRIMVEMFVSFARDGKPKVPVEWTPVKSDELTYLNIESPDKIQINTTDALHDQQFWNNLPFEENEKLFPKKDEL